MVPKTSHERTLLVVGAGPKGVAVAAKRHILKALGWDVPKLIVIERDEVAANWCGKFGFTDGRQHLGTPPHKDIGFPYDSVCWHGYDTRVNREMFSLSWQSYLVTQGLYAKWVDRGRPAPMHGEWARYLQWVARQVDLTPEFARVDKIGVDHTSGKWHVECSDVTGNKPMFEGDGLVVTGPGPARYPMKAEHPNVIDGLRFWNEVDAFRDFRGVVAIIGGGETAASIAVALAQTVSSSAIIQIFTAHAAIYSRGESFVENQRYTDPHDWSFLTSKDREDFIERTDRGVFSIHANSILDHAENVQPRLGKATKIEPMDGGILLHLEYDVHAWKFAVDRVIWATGFNPLWFLDLCEEDLRRRLTERLDKRLRRSTDELIADDLSLTSFTPALHLPMLAGVPQGPGFPNLSSLGRLSDRILAPYCVAPSFGSKPPIRPAWEEPRASTE